MRTLAVCWLVMFAATIGTTASAAGTHTITIEGMRFIPDSVTVGRGETIVWVNKDLVAHTVTAPHVFDSHAVPPGGSWRYVTRKSGHYAYGCTLHPTMKATLIVESKQ